MDCSGASCTECSPETGKPCNDVLTCEVCDTSVNPECLLQTCPKVTDQCYRYLDEQATLHLGCTSEEDYTISCEEEGANCRTCNSDLCNRDGKIGEGSLKLSKITPKLCIPHSCSEL